MINDEYDVRSLLAQVKKIVDSQSEIVYADTTATRVKVGEGWNNRMRAGNGNEDSKFESVRCNRTFGIVWK
jgi:hypothetical protein